MTASATGGTAPYVWGTSGGPIPPGMVLSFDGTLSGTPSAAGNYTFVLIVEDANKQIGAVTKTVNVAPPLALNPSCARLCSVEQGCVTVCGGLGTIDGGARPYKVSVVGGSIPKGMGLIPLALTKAFPTTGDFSFTVLVTDALGVSGTVGANFHVFTHIGVDTSGGTQCGPSYGCTLRMPYNLGTPNATPSLTISNIVCAASTCSNTPANAQQQILPEPPQNTLPNGFSASASGGLITINFDFPGYSTYGDWIGSFDITLTDSSPCSPAGNCSVTVNVQVDTENGFG